MRLHRFALDGDELQLAQQALVFLKQNRLSRVEAMRHLLLLLNFEVLTESEVKENAILITHFGRIKK